jgi:hypothetical protein
VAVTSTFATGSKCGMWWLPPEPPDRS